MRDAKQARAELLVEVGKGRHTGAAASVDHLFEEWIGELKRKGRSPNTVRGYEQSYRRNIAPTLGATPCRKVTDQDAHRPLRRPPARGAWRHGPCTRSTPVSRRCSPGLPLGLAAPTRRSGPTRRRSRTPYRWSRSRRRCRCPVWPRPSRRRPEYARAMYVAATTGVRRSELCAIRRKRSIDWERARRRIGWSVVAMPGRAARRDPDQEPPGPHDRPRRG